MTSTTSLTHDTPHLAEAYDRLSDTQLESGKRLVERLGVASGDRVLDVGCGTGRLARWIAERVGPQGTVVGVDPLPERIAIANANAPGGSSGPSFEVGQAENLGSFADESFDAVCLSAVFHWVENKPKALREIRRVLRPGGRMGVTTVPRELIATGTVAKVFGPVIGRSPYAERADLSALAVSRGPTVTELMNLVVESGLELTELHVVERTRTLPTGGEVVDFFEASSFGNFFRVVPEELRASLRADLVTALEALKGGDGILLRDHGTAFVARRGS
ncbi:MAG: methyltransferase domain-containing protein [Polyangiaceae bacterium]|jgi:ubiquinone/menaquinone biosynthesis C-methylase UbiE